MDSELAQYGDDWPNGAFVRITETGHSAINEVSRITDFTGSTGTATVLPAFSASTGSGTDYELHRYEPRRKFAALDAARVQLSDSLFQLVYDDTLTGDGLSYEYTIPTTIRQGPALVFMERPISAEAQWNLLQSPRNNVTTGWTATNITASTVTKSDTNLLIPKYDEACTKLVTAATTNGRYRQVAADFASGDANDFNGMRLTFGAWVYCRTASRVAVEILDDDGTTTSSTHAGRGWELLTVSRNIAPGNATTLSVEIDVSSAAADLDIYLNHSWLYVGDPERITAVYPKQPDFIVRRDATTQRLILPDLVARGRQIRLIGKDTLSALGTTVASQATNTMELDEQGAQLLCAVAADILFGWEGLISPAPQGIRERIETVLRRKADLATSWSQYFLPRRLSGPYAR